MFTIPKKRGRKPNPYNHCTKEWRSESERALVFESKGFFSDLVSPQAVELSVLSLLENERVAMFRSTIASFGVASGACAVDVNAALRFLSSPEIPEKYRLHRYSVKCVDRKKLDIYAYGRLPTNFEIDHLCKLHRLKQAVLTSDLLGRVAERFVRAHLIASDLFTGVTREERLGKIPVDGDNDRWKSDLMAYLDGTCYCIEVKNRLEALHALRGSCEWVDKHIEMCDAHTKATGIQTYPWLVVAYASKSGIEYCQKNGVGLTVLGFQVLPKEVSVPGGRLRNISSFIDHIRPIYGPRPYQVHGARIVDKNDPATQRLIRYLLTPVVPPYGYVVPEGVARLGIPAPPAWAAECSQLAG